MHPEAAPALTREEKRKKLRDAIREKRHGVTPLRELPADPTSLLLQMGVDDPGLMRLAKDHKSLTAFKDNLVSSLTATNPGRAITSTDSEAPALAPEDEEAVPPLFTGD